MSAVYRAYDPVIDREVALKALPPELARDETLRLRFQEEARAGRRFRRIADHVRALRAAQGLSLDRLASKSGVSRSMLSLIERINELRESIAQLHSSGEQLKPLGQVRVPAMDSCKGRRFLRMIDHEDRLP